jgi:hypothetical protein
MQRSARSTSYMYSSSDALLGLAAGTLPAEGAKSVYL